MTDETETDTDENSIDYDAIEERIEGLHNSLDQIKETGRSLGSDLQNQTDVDEEEIQRHRSVIESAYLLFERVENGDRAIRRGK